MACLCLYIPRICCWHAGLQETPEIPPDERRKNTAIDDRDGVVKDEVWSSKKGAEDSPSSFAWLFDFSIVRFSSSANGPNRIGY